MKFSFNSFAPKLTLAAATVGMLAGCNDPEYATPTPVTTSSVGQARVLVVNAAPGTQGVTAQVDNTAFGTALPYLSTGTYTSVNAGQRLFLFSDPTNIPATPVVTPAPTTPLPIVTTPRTLVSRTSFAGGTSYTTFITDSPTRAYVAPVTATSDQGGIRQTTLTDNLAAPAAGNAKVRFVNMAPTATGGITNYGIYNAVTQAPLFSVVPIRTSRLTTGTTGSPAVAVNFATFTDIAPGTYTFDVRSAAATPIAATQQVITLASGKIYTLYVRGISNGAANNGPTPLGISVITHN